MSEGNHAPSKAGSKGKWAVIFGTVLAVTVAAVSVQFTKAKDTQAATGKRTTTSKPAAKTSVNTAKMARVGNRFITQDQLEKECRERYGKEVLDSLINRMVIQTACEQRGVKVTRKEVDQEIITIAKRFQLEPDSWLQMLKAERGLTALQYKRDVIWPMIALRKLAGKEVQISEQEIQKTYVRDYGPRVKARMIMFDKSRDAQKVWKAVQQNPQDFGRYARKYSVEANSRALDGQIPPIAKYSGSPEIWEAAFKLEEGEVSGIIQLSELDQNKYVFLLSEGKTEPRTTSLQEVREDLVEHLKEEKTQKLVAKVFEEVKREIRVDNYLTNVQTGGIAPASGVSTRGQIKQTAGRK